MVPRFSDEVALANLWKSFKRRYYKPFKRKFAPWRTVRYGDIEVHYKKHLDGGGTYFGQDFIPLLKSWGVPKQPRAFEWCAGPGFIGLSMMANGLCESLCLADINPEAVAACRRTIAANNLGSRVSVYESDNLKDIPSTERWDLVVSNPPHFDDGYFEHELRAHDPGWRIHREFLSAVGKFLKPDGVIILQENNNGSTAATFQPMINASGLKTVFVHNEIPTRTPDHRFFYLGIMREDGNVPDWAKRAAQS